MADTQQTTRYVALGDSFSEGVGDEGSSSFPGWTGRLATALASTTDGSVKYANLAIRGRLFDGVLDEQVPAALQLAPAPTLITFCAGGNNLLRRSFEPQRMIDRLETAAEQITARGATLVLVSPADPSAHLPMGRLIHRRGGVWADALGAFAQRRRLPFVDISRDAQLRNAEFWSLDRLHLNLLGHQRVAELVMSALHNMTHPVAARQVQTAPRSLAAELRYFHTFVRPWVFRRLTGRSSGDHRTASYPDWTHVPRPSRGGAGGTATAC